MKILTMFAAGLAAVVLQAAPIQFVSHAGNQYSAPGHSIPAYKVALERKADILKLDLNLTKDGVIVMMHDRTTGRKMDVNLEILRHDYREIYEKCTYKPVKGFDKEKIVRLEQALELVRDQPISLWLDMKGYTPNKPEQSIRLVDTAVALVRKYGISNDRLMIATWSQPALEYAQKKYPDIRRVLHVSITKRDNGMWSVTAPADPARKLMKSEDIIPCLLKRAEELELFGFNISIWSPFFSRELVQTLQAKGYWISAWFVQQADVAEKAVDAGVNAVVTDNLHVVQPTIWKKLSAKAETQK